MEFICPESKQGWRLMPPVLSIPHFLLEKRSQKRYPLIEMQSSQDRYIHKQI